MYQSCGYKVVTPVQLANIIWAYRTGQASFAGVRVFCAALEMVAIRETASRIKKLSRGRRATQRIRFSVEELVRLTGLARRVVVRERGRLEHAGVFRFEPESITFVETGIEGSGELRDALACKRSPSRPIPVPRRLLAFLAKIEKPVLFLTVIGHVVRGLSLDRRTSVMKAKGTVKLSWVSSVLGVSERAARYARRDLIALGLVTKDIGSRQWKLNRDGAYFEFNLSWRCRGRHTKNAPAGAEERTEIAPPYKTDLTSFGTKDQKTAAAPHKPSGVCQQTKKSPEEPPDITCVQPKDLQCFSRVEELYFQACRRGLIKPSEAAALNFLAAAVRAREATGNVPRIFMGIVRQSLWKHITQQQEDRARIALGRYRSCDPDRFRMTTSTERAQCA